MSSRSCSADQHGGSMDLRMKERLAAGLVGGEMSALFKPTFGPRGAPHADFSVADPLWPQHSPDHRCQAPAPVGTVTRAATSTIEFGLFFAPPESRAVQGAAVFARSSANERAGTAATGGAARPPRRSKGRRAAAVRSPRRSGGRCAAAGGLRRSVRAVVAACGDPPQLRARPVPLRARPAALRHVRPAGVGSAAARALGGPDPLGGPTLPTDTGGVRQRLYRQITR